MASLTTICATRSATVGTVSADCTVLKQLFGMGGDPPSLPPASRPALCGTEEAPRCGPRDVNCLRSSSRHIQCTSRVDRSGGPFRVRNQLHKGAILCLRAVTGVD